MRTLNPAWVEAVQAWGNACPYFQLQSMRLMKVSWGRARYEIELGPKHTQPFGLVHGGVLSTIADAAGFWGVFSQVEDGVAMTTVELKLNFVAPAKAEGKLIAEGRSIKLGRNLGLGEAHVTTGNGRLVAHATTTVMKVSHLVVAGGGELPPKFLD